MHQNTENKHLITVSCRDMLLQKKKKGKKEDSGYAEDFNTLLACTVLCT